MRNIFLALIVMLAIASAAAEGTFAGFSDTEESFDNYIATGNLDLKVAKADASWVGSDFRDDEPYGAGLEACLEVTEVEEGVTYTSYSLLWNAGSVDGTADLHLKILLDPMNLAPDTDVTVWYDVDGDGVIDTEIVSMTLTGASALGHVDVGPLPAEEVRPLRLQLTPHWVGPSDHVLVFGMLFSLVDENLAFSDTEECVGFLTGTEWGGTPGWWHSPAALRMYGMDQLAGWFADIVTHSAWYEDSLATGDPATLYATMLDILKEPAGNSYAEMVGKFRSQYLATRLNAISGQLGLATEHDLSSIAGAKTYLGPSPATLADIIARIEGKAVGLIFTPPPPKTKIGLMKNVCDALNNLDI